MRAAGAAPRLDLKPRADDFALVEKALAKGLLLDAPTPDALRFVPALNVSDAEIAEMLNVLNVLDGLLTSQEQVEWHHAGDGGAPARRGHLAIPGKRDVCCRFESQKYSTEGLNIGLKPVCSTAWLSMI